MAKLAATEAGRERITAVKGRLDHFIAEKIEGADKAAQSQEEKVVSLRLAQPPPDEYLPAFEKISDYLERQPVVEQQQPVGDQQQQQQRQVEAMEEHIQEDVVAHRGRAARE